MTVILKSTDTFQVYCFVIAGIVRSHESDYVVLIESIQLQEHRTKPVLSFGKGFILRDSILFGVGWFWLFSNEYPEVWLKFLFSQNLHFFKKRAFIRHVLLKKIVRLLQHCQLWFFGEPKDEMREENLHGSCVSVDSVWLWNIVRGNHGFLSGLWKEGNYQVMIVLLWPFPDNCQRHKAGVFLVRKGIRQGFFSEKLHMISRNG